MDKLEEKKLFEDIYFESVFREAEDIANSDKEDREKNKDGRSIDYQDNAKTPQVKKYGCYLYSLIKGAHKNPKLADEKYDDYVSSGKMNQNCLIQNPAGILNDLTGDNYRFVNTTTYDPKADIKIAKWVNGDQEHFVLMKDDENVKWDSIGHSKTATNGKIESWRLFYNTSKTA